MVQTQGSMEDRLAVLENALAGLIATSALRHSEVTAQLNNVMQGILVLPTHQNTLQSIAEKQKVLEEKLDQLLDNKHQPERGVQNVQEESVDEQATIPEQQDKASQANQGSTVEKFREVQQLDKNVEQDSGVDVEPQIKAIEEQNASVNDEMPQEKHGYINWDQTYDFLEQHSYVPLYKLRDSIETSSREYNLDPFFDMLKTETLFFKVNKTTRFPSDGLYLNINLPVIQFYIPDIRSTDSSTTFLDIDAVEKFRSIICNNNIKDCMHNQMSFEEKYKLIWAEGTKKTDNKHDSKLKLVLDAQREQLNCAMSLNAQFEQMNSTLSRIEANVGNDNSRQANSYQEGNDNSIQGKQEGNDRTDCHEPLKVHAQLQEMNSTLCRIEANLANDNSRQVNSYQEGCVNWTDCHEPIKLHSYVSIVAFSNTICRLKPKMRIWSAVDIIPWESMFQVNERERFPSNGVFVNVNMPTIRQKTNELCDAIRCRPGDAENLKDDFINFVKNATVQRKDFIHNIVSFEGEYKLKWVEKS